MTSTKFRYGTQPLCFAIRFLSLPKPAAWGFPQCRCLTFTASQLPTSSLAVVMFICVLRWKRFKLPTVACKISVGGETIPVDYAILATPFNIVDKLLPDTLAMRPLREQAAHFGSVPITGIHLWFDREITPLEHAVLLERTIQWMFQKSKILDTRRASRRNW